MVCKLSASSIRGCHPYFSCVPCNDDWFLLSLIDYYRIQSMNKHPNPAYYWRYSYEMNWGWNYSITDFKTQSLKEYFFLEKVFKKRYLNSKTKLLCIYRIMPHIDLARNVKSYLFYTGEKEFKTNVMQYITKRYPPTPLRYPLGIGLHLLSL